MRCVNNISHNCPPTHIIYTAARVQRSGSGWHLSAERPPQPPPSFREIGTTRKPIIIACARARLCLEGGWTHTHTHTFTLASATLTDTGLSCIIHAMSAYAYATIAPPHVNCTYALHMRCATAHSVVRCVITRPSRSGAAGAAEARESMRGRMLSLWSAKSRFHMSQMTLYATLMMGCPAQSSQLHCCLTAKTINL